MQRVQTAAYVGAKWAICPGPPNEKKTIISSVSLLITNKMLKTYNFLQNLKLKENIISDQ